MKHPTDEDIEKAARDYAESFKTGEWFENIRVDAGIHCAKWVRDQQPKLKTLDNWGWQENLVITPIAIYEVFYNRRTNEYKWRKTGTKAQVCDSIDHGKQLAQADYERRINELYI